MKYFEFSTTVVDKVLTELEKAESFIKVAVFQMHDAMVFELLKEKSKQGIKVEVFTLPYDSINLSVYDEVRQLIESLLNNDVIVHFCKWNIGNPERTTTAIGRWYSYHGKFLVTDKSAIILSANFTRQQELDAVLVIDDSSTIKQFSEKFDNLVDLFVSDHSGYDGKIRELILETAIPNVEEVFELPRVIATETHKKHWIQDYPVSIFQENDEITSGLYISPFDGRARYILSKLINEAEQYVYISTESFTDVLFSELLIRTSFIKGIPVSLLTGSTSQDFESRMQDMLRELLAGNVKVYATEQNLHAKLLITDKVLVISSVNLNKMNLGDPKPKAFWRSNTETMYISYDEKSVSEAKKQFERILEGSYDISENLSEKLLKQVTRIFTSFYNLSTNQEVKELFSKFILNGQINYKRGIHKIANLTSLIMKKKNKRIVKKEDFLQALILFYLSERQHDGSQLQERINKVADDVEISQLTISLLENRYIEKEEGFYKINLETLLR